MTHGPYLAITVPVLVVTTLDFDNPGGLGAIRGRAGACIVGCFRSWLQADLKLIAVHLEYVTRCNLPKLRKKVKAIKKIEFLGAELLYDSLYPSVCTDERVKESSYVGTGEIKK